VAGGFFKEAHMAAVEHVEATADKYFFSGHRCLGFWLVFAISADMFRRLCSLAQDYFLPPVDGLTGGSAESLIRE
jgi:hypothetical protein